MRQAISWQNQNKYTKSIIEVETLDAIFVYLSIFNKPSISIHDQLLKRARTFYLFIFIYSRSKAEFITNALYLGLQSTVHTSGTIAPMRLGASLRSSESPPVTMMRALGNAVITSARRDLLKTKMTANQHLKKTTSSKSTWRSSLSVRSSTARLN